MPIAERISNVEELRSWKDEIPFHYEYTAGVAGERFLRGLQEGRILAARCSRCGRKYLPPKTYCVECFVPTTSFVAVGPKGRAAAVAESHVMFDGSRRKTPKTFVFVTFTGVTGGLVHLAGRGVKVGAAVQAKFKPKERRKGTLLDIEEFVA